ncbi:two-component regulator propeller domain-containing protein [Flavivirga abyssicola]|uniref:hybrid sensor histidine kinase/response regulator transcription factor n=1 Tax=Flavivirga abyssicola TaxID=3063533 RepID=UPI0026E0F4E7|nr:hybrid sensor histidine kinase/response regulator transcription factor [Flavivirga sp. MEBiC07777]WVK12650.1 two-component regulator propeller domain-containing protein [Flavivirga sp. MEBiC07777]
MKISNTIFILFMLCFALAQGQENMGFSNNIKFKNYTTKDGLSQRSVTSIIQDNQGFMWFGTRYGLNKFDGHIFKHYNYSSDNINSLSHNWITEIEKDLYGAIWVGTKKGLNKYIPENDEFLRVKTSNASKQYYNHEIWDIKVQDSTFLWIATNQGLDKFNILTNTVLTFNHNKNNPNSISSNKIRNILMSSTKDLWISTSETIDLYNVKSNQFKHYKYPNSASPTITKNNTTTLYEDVHGRIWLGYNNGLAFFNTKTDTFETFVLKSGVTITSSVRVICEDNEGNLWVGTYDGLTKLDLNNNAIYKYENDIIDPKSLSQNSVYDITEDSRGDLWIGTWAGGISYYDKSSNDFVTFSEGYTKKNLNYKVVSSFVEDKNDNLWIGTEGGGINIYNKTDKTFTYLKHDPNNSNSLSANNVKSIIQDYQGGFWVGTHDGGLNHISINENRKLFKRYKNNPSDSTSISDNKITAILEDTNRNIWIGTNEGGLNFFDRKTKIFTRIADDNSVLGNFIYTISKSEKDNSILIGSINGLAKIDVETKNITPVNFRKKALNAYTINPVLSTYQESENSYWVGTEGNGLYNYNSKTNEKVRYGLANGLPNEVIYGILPDDYGNLWISTNKGLSRLNLETKTFKNFEETDGIQGNEFNYGAYLKTKKGNLAFGGTDGFTIFNPNQIEENTFVPPVVITSFSVRNKPFKTITDSINLIELKYNQNDFSFDFVALGYSQPNKNQYAYKLEGFDSDWNFIGNNKTAVYTNLNNGDYTFKVKASNNDGLWNENGNSIKIKIFPPIWRTWWAYILYVLILLTLFWLIRKYTLLRIQDRNELKQERLDKQQMEEVNRLKLQLFTNISHDFRTPLTLIIGPLKRLINNKEGDTYIQNQLNGMYRNASILLQLINQLLDFRKSETGKLLLHASKSDLVTFIKDIKLSFDDMAKDRNITYALESTETSTEVWFDKIEMKKVILNILSNAFKFTPQNGSVSINISDKVILNNEGNHKYVKIEIKDSGKGIPEEDIDYVFDRYFQLGQQNELRSGTGVGLALAKDIVELHHGHIYVESTLGVGSCFTVMLPLGKTHLKPEEIIENDYEDNDILDYYEVANVKSGWIRDDIEIEDTKFDDALPSILIVEDNNEVRQFIKEIFEKDFNVYEAENGHAGIYLAQYNPIDVIVSDVMMPEMNGLEMCAKLKTDIRTSHIPVIMLTARTSSKVQKEGYETGADIYLTKPFDGSTLRLQVLNILKSRKHLIEKFKKDILLEPKEITAVSTDEVFLKKAMQIIEDNLSNANFNVNTFIDKMFMSQSVLYRKVKVLTGQSISEFIRSVRLKKASQLLSQTDMSISNIAYDVGFNDLKYFRKCFKKAFNDTPSQYRKQKNVE